MVRETGFEPATEIAPRHDSTCGCADCDMCRAANALHLGRLRWLEMALNDVDLRGVIAAWGGLPDNVRRAVTVLIGFRE